jgi:hypothetical protein
MDNRASFMELRPDHVFESNKSMHNGSPLSRQYLNLEGIAEVLDLVGITELRGYKVCTT